MVGSERLSISQSSEPAAKRRKLDEPNVQLRDLTADVFFEKFQLFTGSLAIVNIEGKDFKLPKELLCYNSSYFRAALDGNFLENTEQKVILPGFRLGTFQLITQWLFQGNIILPPRKRTPEESGTSFNSASVGTPSPSAILVPSADKQPKAPQTPLPVLSPCDMAALDITTYLEFLEFAQYIDLLGPFDSIISEIKTRIVNDRNCLQSSHIHFASNLQTGHPARVLLAQAATKPYIQKCLDKKCNTFKYSKELTEVDSFAADLLRETSKAFEKMIVDASSYSTSKFTIVDPLVGTSFTINSSYY